MKSLCSGFFKSENLERKEEEKTFFRSSFLAFSELGNVCPRLAYSEKKVLVSSFHSDGREGKISLSISCIWPQNQYLKVSPLVFRFSAPKKKRNNRSEL